MNLFAYGTLQFPQILEAVCGQRVVGEAAVLRGWRRMGVRGAVYPAITREPASEVDGLVFRGLGTGALRQLDAFEGNEYRRLAGRVETRSGAMVPALFYVAAPALQTRLDGRPWSAEQFAATGLSRYLARCRRQLLRRGGH